MLRTSALRQICGKSAFNLNIGESNLRRRKIEGGRMFFGGKRGRDWQQRAREIGI
jgi:hypothetical protein